MEETYWGLLKNIMTYKETKLKGCFILNQKFLMMKGVIFLKLSIKKSFKKQ